MAGRATARARSAVTIASAAFAAILAAPAAATPPQTFIVFNGADSGEGSLRNAMTEANSATGAAFIDFQFNGTIKLTSPLPTITHNVTLESTLFDSPTISGGGSPPFFVIGPGARLTVGPSGAFLAATTGIAAYGALDVSQPVGGAAVRTLSGPNSVLLGDSNLYIVSASTEFSGIIGDGGHNGGIEIGGGRQTLSGVNTYSNVTQIDFCGATLALQGHGSIANSLYVGMFGSGVFDISQTSAGATVRGLFDPLGLAKVKLGGQTLSISDGTFFDGVISDGGIGGGVGGGLRILNGAIQGLNGPNTYTGPTTIDKGGELDLGSGGERNGSIASSREAVVNGVLDISGLGNGGAAVKSLSGAGRVNLGGKFLDVTNGSGAFSGAIADGGVDGGKGGSLRIDGGSLTLTGASTFTGGAFLNAGALIVGNSSALGTGPLTMRDGTFLRFLSGVDLANALIFPGADPTVDTGAHNVTLSGVISGPGGLTKLGRGRLDLTATNTYTGATDVAAGALQVDGSIAHSAVTVESGASLSGGGVIGSLVAHGGAVVAPGAQSPQSTLHVARDVSFLPGSIYRVGITASGGADRLSAGGKASLSGGTVDVIAAPGVYSPSKRYTILVAKGGLAGTFAGLTTTSNLAFLTPKLSYRGDAVQLGFSQQRPLVSGALTRNEKSTAGAVSLLGAGSPIYAAVLGQSFAGAPAAFDALSGEIHASAVSAAFDDLRLPREAVLDRLASPYGAPASDGASGATTRAIAAPNPAQVFAAWGQAFGSFGRIGGDGNAATLDRSLGGFIVGADATLDARYRIGAAAGYTQSQISVDARGSSGHVDAIFGGVYGGASFSALQLRGGALYAANRYGTNRTIAFPGFGDAASAGYGGDTLQAFGEAGWRTPLGGPAAASAVEPFVGAMAMHIATASFAEAGGAAALDGAAQGYDYGATTLGLRLEAAPFAGAPVAARGMIAWRHVFGDVTPTSTLAFASAPALPFVIAGAPIARDSLALEAGLDWRLTANATIGVFYSGDLAAHDEDNAIKGRLEVAF